VRLAVVGCVECSTGSARDVDATLSEPLQRVCVALAHLSASCDAVALCAVALGAVHTLLAVMPAHARDAGAMGALCAALRPFCERHACAAAAALRLGALPAMQQALRAHGKHEGAEHISELIEVLQSVDAAPGVHARSGGGGASATASAESAMLCIIRAFEQSDHAAVLATMQGHLGVADVQISGVNALSRLCDDDGVSARALSAPAAVAMVAAMRAHAGSERVHLAALYALCRIATLRLSCARRARWRLCCRLCARTSQARSCPSRRAMHCATCATAPSTAPPRSPTAPRAPSQPRCAADLRTASCSWQA
jgi:hypothetical protein